MLLPRKSISSATFRRVTRRRLVICHTVICIVPAVQIYFAELVRVFCLLLELAHKAVEWRERRGRRKVEKKDDGGEKELDKLASRFSGRGTCLIGMPLIFKLYGGSRSCDP